MWRLTSDTLPTEPIKRQGAPVATIWAKGSRIMAPVCRIATSGEVFDLPEPQFLGYYHFMQLPWMKGRITGIPGLTFGKLNQAEPNTYWQQGRRVGIVASNDSPVTINAQVILPVPVPTPNYLYRLDFSQWGEVQVTGASSEGMEFLPSADPDNLTHPEWKFESNILTIAATSYCAPRSRGTLEIDLQITSQTPVAKVFKFQFPKNITECDLIEHLGVSYPISANAPFPNPCEFIWNRYKQAAYVFGRID